MKSLSIVILLMLSSSLTSGEEMEGMYYCTSKASVGIEDGVGKVFKTGKFTAKIKVGAAIVLTGDTEISYKLSSINDDRNWVYGTAGAAQYFMLRVNDFALAYNTFSAEGELLPKSYMETGTCQRW